jgi:flavin reductase (DIM6/NTAB) family NADH-FMN oxidoreductase RutF
MSNRPGSVTKAHRLLAPRIAYLIGTRASNGEANLIPVSNATSISTNPQFVVVAVFKDWQTYDNLQRAEGFTLSVPTIDHREGVWKLGARYSRYEYPDRATKLHASGLALIDDRDPYGPILADGLGWLSCRIVARPDFGGDHGVIVGEIIRVEFNPGHFQDDGTPTGDLHPLMQVTGNRFTTSGETTTIAYGAHT